MVGILLFTYMSDNYGRKYAFIRSWILTTLGVGLMICSNNLILILIGNFFFGIGGMVATFIIVLLLNESSGIKIIK